MLHFTLNNGIEIPAMGFGTYKASEDAMSLAIREGCRYFDSASVYGNEAELGRAINQSGIPRENFMIASKVWKTDLGCEKTIEALNRTLENLNTDYVDVYFIHWPNRELNLETWNAMETLYSQGKIKALGLSNFFPYHAEEILNHCTIKPSVAQLEFHPGHTQAFALNYYRERKILVQAWSPTARGRVFSDVLIRELAEKYSASPAQICLAFCLCEGVMPLPKSSSSERLRENLAAQNISLNSEDIMRLENMPPCGWSGEHPDRERVKI